MLTPTLERGGQEGKRHATESFYKMTYYTVTGTANNRSSSVCGTQRHGGNGKFLQFTFELFHQECKDEELQ